MSAIVLKGFGGMAPLFDPLFLPEGGAQDALNTRLFSGDARPWKQPFTVRTPTKAGTKKSVYRYGQDVAGDADYWFTWTTDVDVVRGPIAGDTEERTYFTGDGVPKVTNSTLALTGGTDYPQAAYNLGIPKPVAAPSVSVSGTPTPNTVAETRTYVYTYVSGWGEEGPPSDVSNSITIFPGEQADLSALSTGPAGSYDVDTKRIYRTNTGTASTDFQFVAEIAVANTTYADTKTKDQLGEVIPSKNWVAPPSNMVGLKIMANGIAAGFIPGTGTVCFSEAFLLHAWPVGYQQPVDFKVVGLGAFGSSLFIGTQGHPYIATGVDPSAMSLQRMEERQACVSKRSIAEMSDGVVYASPDGLVGVGPAGVQLLTADILSRDEWQTYKPESISGYQLDGMYFAFYDTGAVQGGLVFDLTGRGPKMWRTDVVATAGFTDPRNDGLYLAIGSNVQRWDGGVSALTQKWKSKIYRFQKAKNFAWGQVHAGGYSVTLRIYADGVLKHTQTVTNSQPFRLPSGFKAVDWEIEWEGVHPIESVVIAEAIEELRNV